MSGITAPLHDTPTRQPIDPGKASAVQRALGEQLSTMSAEADTSAFLDKYFPIRYIGETDISDMIHASLVGDSLYDNGRWHHLPASKPYKEKDMYPPFMEILNGICKHVELSGLRNDQQYLPGQWIDTSKRVLKSDNPSVGTLLPDISFVSKSASAPEKKDSKIWWMHVFTVVEVKITKVNPPAQLSSYVRHIFMEQLDRHFVLALTLNTDLLNVYLFDRSGVVGMTEPINIHIDPKTFIRVIAGFSCLPPEQLGWDPTCHVWDGQTTIPSYAASTRLTGGWKSAYDLPWVFECAKGDADSSSMDHTSSTNTQDPSQYVTLRTLTLEDAGMVWGRATLVFEVVTLDDWKQKNPE
ncbi:hypothetical protein P691DRAFT_785551, partial [Macrolepiota fuliginosa MF-IS2]